MAMQWKSIRVRLAIWYSGALAAALLIFGCLLWLSMWHSLRTDVNRTLTERMRGISLFLREELKDPNVDLPRELAEYSQGLPTDTFVHVDGVGGLVSYSSYVGFPWSSILNPEKSARTLFWQKKNYAVLTNNVTIQESAWHISLAVSLENVEEILRRLRWLLFALVPLAVLVAPIAGSWLSRRALKPVDDITAAARQISIQNLSDRLDVPATGDELERLAHTWNSMLARLDDAVSRLSRFTSDASHELRTPLAVIRTTAELTLRKARSVEGYQSALEQVVKETERMTTLIEHLLFLARCDTENLTFPKQRFSLASVLADACTQMRPVAEAYGVRLALEELGDDCMMIGNAPSIERLLLIVIDNAIKYSRKGGTVQAGLSRGSTEILLAVHDEGPGVAEDELPFIFQRFYRGMNARERGNDGFGLGLALAEGIAELHDTSIKVASTRGEGSTFSIAFAVDA
jgi:two-component system, OmpR family, heavy metal sensor histidine kinase CusS